MKIYLFIIPVILTATLNSSAEGSDSKTDREQQMQQLKKEVSADLTGNLLPYWSKNMADNVNGGFYGRIDGNEKVYPDEDKGGILNARILWTYSSAYRIYKDTAYLRLANRAKDYIMAHFIDKQYGGAYRSVNAKGEPSDTRKQTYTQTFFIYAMAEYSRATGDKEALKTAREIFEAFEKYALDKESNGYFEVFSRDWQRTRDKLIGETTINDEKTMNTHLHLMEAYTNLYRVCPDKRMEERLRNVVEIFLDHIIDKQTAHLICFMDKSWKRTSMIDSYGHDIEASWLLCESANLLGDPELLARVNKVSLRIADAASEGLQPDGSMLYEKDLASGHMPAERSWWVLSEAIVGYLNAYELSGNEKYLDRAINSWNYTKKHLIDNKNGGWYSGVSESGIAGKGDKAGFWICPYHNGRMCMEVVERVSGSTHSSIDKHPDNPHYFSYKGKPLVLITTDQHYGAVINLDFDYIAFLDRLQEYGMNLTRIYPGGYVEMKDMYTKGNPLGPAPERFILPWKKSGEVGANPDLGKYKYDLDKWDIEYFSRLKDFVYQASVRNIIVEIAFFNGMYDDRWTMQPLYNTNNIQGVGKGDFKLFTTMADPVLAGYQAEYVKKIATELYKFDNIIYDISDEPEMQHKESYEWNSTLLDALISVDHNRHIYGETANSASPDFTGDSRTSWIPTEYISPMENTLDNDYSDNKPIVDVETAYYSYWYGANPVEESRTESWYGMVGGLAGIIQLNSDFSTHNPSGKGTSTQDTILPQKKVLMDFMNSLDFVKMEKFTGFRVSDSTVLVRGIAEPGNQYALYLFHGTRKWEDWPQGRTAMRFNVEMNWFRDTVTVEAAQGNYKAEWIHPASGTVMKYYDLESKDGKLVLDTPLYMTDIALRVKRN